MGEFTDDSIQQDEQQTLPQQKVERNVIQRIIDKLKSPETLDQVTGGTWVPKEDSIQEGKSPISPLDDFLKEKSTTPEKVEQGE